MGQQMTKWKAEKNEKKTFFLSKNEFFNIVEDGDLILLRENVQNTTLQLEIAPQIVKDIQLLQHGMFPNKRFSSLPGAFLEVFVSLFTKRLKLNFILYVMV